jgi:hypothetical protein
MDETEKNEKLVTVREGAESEKNMLSTKTKKQFSPVVIVIRKTAIWIAIVSAIILALVTVLAIWADLRDIQGRAWSTFFVIALVSVFIAIIAPLLDQVER